MGTAQIICEPLPFQPATPATSLDELLEYCTETGTRAEITGQGPGRGSETEDKFTVEGGRKYIVVKESVLASTSVGEELLRDWKRTPEGRELVYGYWEGRNQWISLVRLLACISCCF